MNIVTVYLKGPWGRGGKDEDRGMLEVESNESLTLVDNDYGLNRRRYPMGNVARIEHTGHW